MISEELRPRSPTFLDHLYFLSACYLSSTVNESTHTSIDGAVHIRYKKRGLVFTMLSERAEYIRAQVGFFTRNNLEQAYTPNAAATRQTVNRKRGKYGDAETTLTLSGR